MAAMQYPEFEVTLDGQDPFRVASRFQDLTIVERGMAADGLPGMKEAPLSWAARVSYYAAKRTGKIDQTMPYEAYESQIESIETFGADDDEEVTADPTQQGA